MVKNNLPPQSQNYIQRLERENQDLRTKVRTLTSRQNASSAKADTNTKLLHDFVLNRTQPRQFYTEEQIPLSVNTGPSYETSQLVYLGEFTIPDGYPYFHIQLTTNVSMNNTLGTTTALEIYHFAATSQTETASILDMPPSVEVGHYYNGAVSANNIGSVTAPVGGVYPVSDPPGPVFSEVIHLYAGVWVNNNDYAYTDLNGYILTAGSIYFSKTGE